MSEEDAPPAKTPAKATNSKAVNSKATKVAAQRMPDRPVATAKAMKVTKANVRQQQAPPGTVCVCDELNALSVMCCRFFRGGRGERK